MQKGERGETRPTGLLICDVLLDEVNALLAELGLEARPRVEFAMGLHDTPERLREALQGGIERLEAEGCGRIVLVFGLCSNSILGLRARQAELVLVRAHDCITLYLGSRERYAQVQRAEPGTYWFSPGWCKGQRVPGPGHFERMQREFTARFDDPEDVEYLLEMEKEKYRHYQCAAFTHLGCGDVDGCRAATQESAAALGMRFEEVAGDDRLLRALLAGPWVDDARFLVVPAGKTAGYSGGPDILKVID